MPRGRKGVTRTSLSDALQGGAAGWDGLLAGAQIASPFMSWAWHRAWADSAPTADVQASEVVQLHGADGSLHAFLPVRLGRERFRRIPVRAVSWAIGDTGCPDELDVPSLPEADLQAFAEGIEDIPWQIIVLGNLAQDAQNVQRLREALEERGHTTRHRPLWSCPRLELPASWDAYLGTLSPNRRQILRRKARALHRDHAVALVDYDQKTLDAGWGHLLALHAQRWNGTGGAFRDPRTARLHRQFAAAMARTQRLWLSTLNLDGHPVAAWYGFTSADTVYFYQGGRDPQWQRESVGLVLMSLMIQRAIERGYRVFNFLRGEDEYKSAWKPAQRMTGEMVVFRSGWRGRGLRLLDAIAARRGGAVR